MMYGTIAALFLMILFMFELFSGWFTIFAPLLIKASINCYENIANRFYTHKNLIFLQSGYNSYLQIESGESACSLPNHIKIENITIMKIMGTTIVIIYLWTAFGGSPPKTNGPSRCLRQFSLDTRLMASFSDSISNQVCSGKFQLRVLDVRNTIFSVVCVPSSPLLYFLWQTRM